MLDYTERRKITRIILTIVLSIVILFSAVVVLPQLVRDISYAIADEDNSLPQGDLFEEEFMKKAELAWLKKPTSSDVRYSSSKVSKTAVFTGADETVYTAYVQAVEDKLQERNYTYGTFSFSDNMLFARNYYFMHRASNLEECMTGEHCFSIVYSSQKIGWALGKDYVKKAKFLTISLVKEDDVMKICVSVEYPQLPVWA